MADSKNSHAQLLKNMNATLFKSVDMDQKATVEDMMGFVNNHIQKLKVSFLLPSMLNKRKYFAKLLKGTKYEEAIQYLQRYKKTKPNQNPISREMSDLIDYMTENCEILSHIPDYKNYFTFNEKRLLEYMETLKGVAFNHFVRSPEYQLEEETRLNKIHKKMNLETKIKKKRYSTMWKTTVKKLLIKKMEKEVETLDQESQAKLTDMLSDLQSQYEPASGHINRMKELEDSYQNTEQRFVTTRTNNINAEKKALHEKNKLVLQLESLIKKYDEVMYMKHCELVQLDEELEQVKQELADFMPTYKREAALHYELVVKVEEEKERAHQARVQHFIQNRAAKIIQRWLRKILRERRKAFNKSHAAKGKKKGNKKKKN